MVEKYTVAALGASRHTFARRRRNGGGFRYGDKGRMRKRPDKAQKGDAREVQVAVPAFASVQDKVVVVRGVPVMLDFDIAALYGVETKRVNEAVRNNPKKFPSGYVFELDSAESQAIRSKFSTLESRGKIKHTVRRIKKA